jgi:hypothetical protein
MLQNDNDIVRGLGFVALYSAYLEEQIDKFLFMLSEVEKFTEKEQRWPVSQKIEKAKAIANRFYFEGRDYLIATLDIAKRLSKTATKYFTVESTLISTGLTNSNLAGQTRPIELLNPLSFTN